MLHLNDGLFFFSSSESKIIHYWFILLLSMQVCRLHEIR